MLAISFPSEREQRIKRSDAVPKIKTNRGAAKRFKKTSTGKISRRKAFASHILTKNSTKRKRNLRRSTSVHQTNAKSIKRLIPYA
jgi:large subunit ribosomal protein L35